MKSFQPIQKNSVTDIQGLLKSIEVLIKNKKYTPLNVNGVKEIMDKIKDILYPLYINITYENLSCLDKVEKIRNELSQDSSLLSLQLIKRIRLILTTHRHKANFNIPLVRQCNGIIIEIFEENATNFCKLLVMPPQDFNPNFVHSAVDEAITNNEFDVYEINDGTTFNIYYDPHIIIRTDTLVTDADGHSKMSRIYHEGSWLRSTRNAFDIDELVWRGHSYRTIIDDILKQHTDPDISKLDKNIVYSIGFKHPAFHPFGQPAEWNPTVDTERHDWHKSCWLIQKYDTKNMIIVTESSSVEVLNIPTQVKLSGPFNLKNMINVAESSLAEYLKKSETAKSPFLGYLLRSNTAKTSQSDILLESSLWHAIRHLIYQLPFTPNKIMREKQEQNFKNMQYIIIDSFLDLKKGKMFTQLFPQFSSQFEKLNRMIAELVDKIYVELTTISKPNPNILVKYDSPDNRILDLLAIRFTPIVREQFSLPAAEKLKRPGLRQPPQVRPDVKPKNSNSNKKVIHTILMNPKYTDIYMSIIDSS